MIHHPSINLSIHTPFYPCIHSLIHSFAGADQTDREGAPREEGPGPSPGGDEGFVIVC